MVRYICVTKGTNFQQPEHHIISLEQFTTGVNGIDQKTCEDLFNDMTTNFTDLGYWNSKTDLDGLNVRQVETKIKHIIEQLLHPSMD